MYEESEAYQHSINVCLHRGARNGIDRLFNDTCNLLYCRVTS